MTSIKLSISLLISNRLDTIRRCLDSLKPIMEQIPSELILVDTSNNPKVHEILLEYTDKVVEFEWCNDFAKARNTGLKLATGEWFMYLDDDEWFVEIEPLVRFFQSEEYKGYGYANYIVRNFLDEKYINYTDSWVSRLVKLEKDTHFESKIHEYFYPVKGKCKAISAIANHSGYIFKTEEDKLKHFERNAQLLKGMIIEEPHNLRWQVQLAQEYRSAKKWQEMYELCDKGIEENTNLNSKYDNYNIGTFYAGAVEALLRLERYEEGIEIAHRATQDKRNSPMCHAAILLLLGGIYQKKQDWVKAQNSCFEYLKLCREIKKNPVSMEEQKFALIVGETLDSVPTKRAYSIMIISSLKQNDISLLKKYIDKLEWDKKVIYVYDGLLDVLVETMVEMPYDDVFLKIINMVWNNKELKKQLYLLTQKIMEEDVQKYYQLLRIFTKLDDDNEFLCYSRVILNEQDNDIEHIEENLRKYYKCLKNIFEIPKEISQIAKKYDFSEEKELLSVSFETWSKHLVDELVGLTRDGVNSFENMLRNKQSIDHVFYDYSYMRIAETQLLHIQNNDSISVKKSIITKFVKVTCDFYRAYHTEDSICKYSELLPDYARAAFILEEAFQYEDKDSQKFVNLLKKAVEVNSSIADIIGCLLKDLNVETDEMFKLVEEQDEVSDYQDIRLLLGKEESFLLLPEEIWTQGADGEISLEQLLLDLSTSQWAGVVAKLQENKSEEMWNRMRERLASIQSCDDIRYDYFQMNDAWQMLCGELNYDYAAMSEILIYWAEANLSYTHKVYSPKAFEEAKQIIPSKCKAALEIEKMFSCGKTDWNGRLEYLGKAAQYWNEIGSAAKVYARLIGEEQERVAEQAKSAQSELEVMANQMKLQIRAMIDNGMKEQALSIIQQLRQMLPEDRELIELERECLLDS